MRAIRRTFASLLSATLVIGALAAVPDAGHAADNWPAEQLASVFQASDVALDGAGGAFVDGYDGTIAKVSVATGAIVAGFTPPSNDCREVATDRAGYVYSVCDHEVVKLSTATGLPAAGFDASGSRVCASDLAVDGQGRVFATGYRYLESEGCSDNTTFVGLSSATGATVPAFDPDADGDGCDPAYLTADGAGSLYVVDGECTGTVEKLSASTGAVDPGFAPTNLLSGCGSHIAANGSGTVFVVDHCSAKVRALNAVTGAWTKDVFTAADGSYPPFNLTSDRAGSLYARLSESIVSMSESTGAVAPFFSSASGLGYPGAMDADDSGDVFVAQGDEVLKVDGVTGTRVPTFVSAIPADEDNGGCITDVAARGTKLYVASGCYDAIVSILDAATGALLTSFDVANPGADDGQPCGSRITVVGTSVYVVSSHCNDDGSATLVRYDATSGNPVVGTSITAALANCKIADVTSNDASIFVSTRCDGRTVKLDPVTAAVVPSFAPAAQGAGCPGNLATDNTHVYQTNGCGSAGATMLSASNGAVVASSTLPFTGDLAEGGGDLYLSTFTQGIWRVTPGSPAAPQPPALLSGPSISGTTKVGSTLTCTSRYTGATAVTYSWRRNGVAIAGLTSRSLKLSAADYAKRLRCTTTATNADGRISNASAQTAIISAGSALRPTTAPVVTGTSKVGKTLKVSKGIWAPGATYIAYQWLRDGKAVKGATKGSYKLTSKAKGHRYSVKVTAKRYGYANGATFTKKTSKVKKG